MKSKTKILILDCDHKNALAIVRHLGKTGNYDIDGVSYQKQSIAFFSKYISEKHIICNPKQFPEKYIRQLLQLLDNKQYAVLLPVSYLSYQLCSIHQKQISEKTKLTIATPEQMRIANSKISTQKVAEEAGIPVPKTIVLTHIDEIEQVETTFPCVIKAPLEMGKSLVEYANNKSELVDKFKRMCHKQNFNGQLPIIQEYLTGHGAGFFAYYKNGQCQNYFMHRRIREYPPSGGVSACAESFFNEDVLTQGKKLLDYLQWEGVAMVEFKKNQNTNKYNLLEINAKFWGSLELSIVSGVNFPEMVIDSALEKKIEKVDQYKQVRFQWILLGDLLHTLERPRNLFAFLRDLFVAKNDIYLTDLKPNIFQFLYIPVHYYKKWLK